MEEIKLVVDIKASYIISIRYDMVSLQMPNPVLLFSLRLMLYGAI
jgi:hypothetical protein